MDRTTISAALIVATWMAATLAACRKPAGVVVGSKNFTEQVLLGEIVAQQIERTLHVPVEHKLNLGGTLLAHQALTSGAIDLYPEYTGTALTAVLKEAPSNDRESVLQKVREQYERRWHVAWLQPLGFNDTFAMMIRGEMARSERLTTLSEAAHAHAWRLGVGYEFLQRPDGLAGLQRAYDLRTQGGPVSMDLGLLYAALGSRKVDLIAANSTDGLASAMDVTILQDDRRYFPPYECAVVAREDALARYPGLRGALEALSGKLTDDVMRRLNYQVDGRHRSVVDVAKEFLGSVH
jgi:glycine betaine/choline ABC-type transport system substrate-binding protein